MHDLIVAGLLALAALSMPSTQERAPRASDARTRDIYVSVVDRNGKPAAGLGIADFTVREDGVAREVVNVAPATEPLTISVLVDDSEAATQAIPFMRDGLSAFVEAVSGKAEVAIATFGERPTSQIDFTTSTEALKKTAGRLFQRSGSGSYLLDALIEASRGLEKRAPKRGAILVLTTEGVEFSNRSYQQVLAAIRNSGATLHVISLGQPSLSQADEMRNRNMAIAEGTAQTGGRRDQVLALSGLPDRLKQVAEDLTNQYVVTYGRPESLIPPEKVQVSVSRAGLTARARTRLAER
jgi:VWFA-related protein